MRCPHCAAATRVLSTRHDVIRRRECVGAARHRFTTTEVPHESMRGNHTKPEKVEAIRRLAALGLPVSEVAALCQVLPKTVRRYVGAA